MHDPSMIISIIKLVSKIVYTDEIREVLYFLDSNYTLDATNQIGFLFSSLSFLNPFFSVALYKRIKFA